MYNKPVRQAICLVMQCIGAVAGSIVLILLLGALMSL